MFDSIRFARARRLARAAFSFSIALSCALAGESAGAACRYCTSTTTTTTTTTPDNFISYVVTLNSLKLISTTGQKVEVLPIPLNVDLAQTVNLQRAVDSGKVPVGTYTSAQAVIDFSHANLVVETSSGAHVTLTAVDGTGLPVTTPQTVSIRIDHQRYFVVSSRTAALDSLDFNLGSFNTVNISNATVDPRSNLLADVVPSGNTWVQLSGTLSNVATDGSGFVLTVPATAINSAARGPVATQLTPTTTYKISGAAYTGAAGAAMLATLPTNTAVTETGSLSGDHKTLVAAKIVIS